MSLPYMPFYIGDHLRDTSHLTVQEHGAYVRLICKYWTKGSCLPDDDKQLARITGMSVTKWRKIRPTVQAFFYDGWRHKRIDAELAKAAATIEKRQKAATVRWEKSSKTEPKSNIVGFPTYPKKAE
jgi:uncharacterized protein YdaU (DUF1376 family)